MLEKLYNDWEDFSRLTFGRGENGTKQHLTYFFTLATPKTWKKSCF